MSSLEWALLGAFIILAGAALGILVLSRRTGRPASRPGRQEEDAHLRIAVHGLMLEMSEQVQTLLGESDEYGEALTRHKAGIESAGNRASLKEIEQSMLAEVVRMKRENDTYRQELQAARKTIEAQQAELEQLNQDASKDFLTEIANRRTFDARLREEVARFQRHAQLFSVVILDIDHFKRVNDTHGHLAGDHVLRAVSALLEQRKRASDFLARYGGEEFVLILPETQLDQAMRVARELNSAVAQARISFEGKRIKLTISAGATEIGKADEAAAHLLKRADQALYRAKENGRNRVEGTHSNGDPVRLL